MPSRHLDQTFLSKLRPVHYFLRSHFREAVLTNMKGAGEPWLETEFLPSADTVNGVTRQHAMDGVTCVCYCDLAKAPMQVSAWN